MAKKTSVKATKKAVKKTVANKAPAKRVVAKRTVAKKAPAKKVSKKAASVASVASKAQPKKTAIKAPARVAPTVPSKTNVRTPAKAVLKTPVKVVARVPTRVPKTGREPWQDDLRRFVREWRAEHPRTKPRGVRMARTFLRVTRTSLSAAEAAGLGQKHIPVLVQNLGNVAAYNCVVRALEARPRSPIHEKIPLSEFKLGGQLMFTLQPGEQKEVRIPYLRTQVNGTFIALISDPLLDPNELMVADWNHRRVLLFNLV